MIENDCFRQVWFETVKRVALSVERFSHHGHTSHHAEGVVCGSGTIAVGVSNPEWLQGAVVDADGSVSLIVTSRSSDYIPDGIATLNHEQVISVVPNGAFRAY